jgi:tRNA threonylcarbamoyladenosine biosynthesis protein TsaB
MTLLAIETATDVASAALLEGEALVASLAFRARRDVCQRLLTDIEAMMARTGIAPESISAVAVGRGPGSFTGIRIGVAIAKGLSLALGAPLFGISTLAACAYPTLGAGGLACAVIPAHGDELYTGIFRADNALTPIEEGIWSASGLIGHLSQLGERVTFVTNSSQVRQLLPLKELTVEHRFLPGGTASHLASWAGLLAQARIAVGDAGDGIGLAPVYLRPSQAEMQLGPGPQS